MDLFRNIKKSLSNLFLKKTADRDEAAELNILLNHLPMAMYWKDADLTYRGSNSRFEKIIGISRAELIGKTDMDINSKEAAAIFRKEDMDFLSGKKKDMYFTDKLVLMKDNSEIWARTYKIPIFGNDSGIKYIMGLIQDVTKIKQDEIALAESEVRLRTILNATNDRIIFVDSLGKILVANGSFLNDFARENSETTGKNLDELVSQKLFEKTKESMEIAAKTGEPHSFDILPDESEAGKYFEVSVYPVITGGEVIGTAIFAKDITGRKQTEEMLVKRSEQLQTAITEAENASKAKSEFLSRMSHEIRTPIGAITGMTKIACATDDLNKIKDCLQKIDNSSKHLLGIINDVLDMSKIEADKFVLADTVFRFENMCMDVASVVGVRADEKRQNFEIMLDETMPEYFCADEMRLRQIITNLLSNAVKFTPEYGTIRLNVNNLGVADDIAAIEVIVSDTGIGIAPEQQARLFRPFEQADSGITRQYGGTGLGLVICKKIVEMMGGQIRIESEQGNGSRFIFDVKMKVHGGKKRADRIIKFSDMRALVVDDSLETREYLSNILTKFGIRAETAQDGYEALKKVNESKNSEESFNIFFIDWSMPGMDGIETTIEIKSVTDDNAVVIMISATEWDKIENQAVEAGIVKFISKPLFPSTVLSVLDEIAGTSAKYEIKTDKRGIPDLAGYRILLVEDIEINREIAIALLEPTNAKVDFATNGKEAVDKYNSNKGSYDLILMDIHMPQMDGYEATGLIRANKDEKSLTIPIIAMTADAFKEDIDKCKAVGMNDHIAKPINEDELYKKILLCRGLFRKNKIKSVRQTKMRGKSNKMGNIYLDEEEAMKRLSGNKKLYCKLLKRFLDSAPYQKVAQSMTDGDIESAGNATHAMKGMAANLSLKAVYDAAAKMEAMLKSGSVDLSVQQDFEKITAETNDVIEKFLNDEGAEQ